MVDHGRAHSTVTGARLGSDVRTVPGWKDPLRLSAVRIACLVVTTALLACTITVIVLQFDIDDQIGRAVVVQLLLSCTSVAAVGFLVTSATIKILQHIDAAEYRLHHQVNAESENSFLREVSPDASHRTMRRTD